MSKRKKGGSLASDAVTKLLTPQAFDKMSLNASNVLKGGSIASDAVTKLLTPQAFEKMSLNATNVVKGGKKPCNNHRAVLVCANCAKKLSGGGACGAVQQPPKRGGGSGAASKSTLKNINEYKTASPFKLWNGRGGSDDKPVSIGLKSDSSITSFNKLQGTVQDRGMDATALKILANEDISGPIQMAKTMRFGNVTGTTELDTNFSYGGRKRVTKKRVTKKRV
jgi:hypothetical protein